MDPEAQQMIISRLDRLESKIDDFADHNHREKVSWAALVPLLGAISIALFQAMP